MAAPGNWLGDREVQSQRVLRESLKVFVHLSPKLFPATCLSLGSLRGGVLLTQGRPPPSPGRSLTSFRGGFAFIIYG